MAGRKKSPQDFFKVQNDIRRNASRLQDSLRDLADWETSVKKKDLAIRKKVKTNKSIPAVRGSGRKVYASTTGSGGAVKPHPWLKNDNSDSTTNMKKEKKKIPSAHVYDKGYSKWENFDVESALKEVDINDDTKSRSPASSSNTNIFEENDAVEEKNAKATKTTPKYASPAAAHRARKAKEAADKAAA